jgi:hypothetical protein
MLATAGIAQLDGEEDYAYTIVVVAANDEGVALNSSGHLSAGGT